jgi:predicted nucleic acid-binding protein
MRIFLDSSALVKRYVVEEGTEKVSDFCGRADEIVLSVLCVPEVLSACNRLKRSSRLNDSQYRKIKKELALDVDEATIIDMTSSIIENTIMCLETGSVKTLDAIHIASALESGCDLFLSADKNQCKVAKSLNLSVEVV